MGKNKIITVQDIPITVSVGDVDDFICITDMAAARTGGSRASDVIKNWIRNRSTLEYLGTWEQIYNPNFKVVEFDHFKKQAGLPLFTLSVSDWDELNTNNWYEFVEYGTTNPLTILLQRNGFSRESARFIKENPEYVVKDGSTEKLKLKASLSKCGRTSVENDVEYIRQNVPGIFTNEEDE